MTWNKMTHALSSLDGLGGVREFVGEPEQRTFLNHLLHGELLVSIGAPKWFQATNRKTEQSLQKSAGWCLTFAESSRSYSETYFIQLLLDNFSSTLFIYFSMVRCLRISGVDQARDTIVLITLLDLLKLFRFARVNKISRSRLR